MLGNQPEYEPTAPWNEEFMQQMIVIAAALQGILELLEERMN